MDCEDEVNSFDKKDEEKLIQVFKSTFPAQRVYINSERIKSISDILLSWPILLEKKFLLLHFELFFQIDLLNNCRENLTKEAYNIKKLSKIVQQNVCHHSIFTCLAEYFKEDEESIIKYFDEYCTKSEMKQAMDENSFPVILCLGGSKSSYGVRYYLHAEGELVTDCDNFEEAFPCLFAIYFNINICYILKMLVQP